MSSKQSLEESTDQAAAAIVLVVYSNLATGEAWHDRDRTYTLAELEALRAAGVEVMQILAVATFADVLK